jgi:hypothetical protein
MLRSELVKQGETIAVIAARNAELPVLSENVEQLKKSAVQLMRIKDVSFVSFHDRNFRALLREGGDAYQESIKPGQPTRESGKRSMRRLCLYGPCVCRKGEGRTRLFNEEPVDSDAGSI